MNKTLKRISILAAAFVMSLTMAATAFAATTTNGVVASTDTTVNIDKSILVFNANGSTVYQPGITYNYTIAPATASNATVTDVDGNSAVVQDGVTGGITLTDNTAVFAATQTVAGTAEGAAITDTITASVDLTKFTKAGIYRYVITEAQPDNLTAVGITRPSGYVATRYLDVYIKNGANGLAVYGYVCFIGDTANEDSANVIDGTITDNNEIKGKTTGFVEQYDIDPTTGASLTGNMADRYYTYDFTVTKEITGDLADMTHKFPFVLATSGAVSGQKFTVAVNDGGALISGATNGVAAIGTNVEATLGNLGVLTIKGLPANAKFNVTETNDTLDTYKVTISGVQDGDNEGETSVSNKGTHAVNANAINISSYTAFDGGDPTTDGNYSAIKFTNKLESVSPTGVVLRYGPFVFMLVAGVALLALSMRRRESDDEI